MGRIVLAWDAPNIDMTLSQLLGRRPGHADRPDMRAVLRWLVERRSPGDRSEAAVFVNVPPERPQALQGWVVFLQSIGFRVFAKPKVEGSDIDEAMVAYIRNAAADASQIVVGSNDARRFVEPVREIAATVKVTVLGFVELAGELAESNGWEFVDLEEVPDVIRVPLQRTRLDRVPEEGGWFEPLSHRTTRCANPSCSPSSPICPPPIRRADRRLTSPGRAGDRRTRPSKVTA